MSHICSCDFSNNFIFYILIQVDKWNIAFWNTFVVYKVKKCHVYFFTSKF